MENFYDNEVKLEKKKDAKKEKKEANKTFYYARKNVFPTCLRSNRITTIKGP